MLDSGTSYSLEKCSLGWNSDLTGAERPVRGRVENSSSNCQVSHRSGNPFPSTERSEREINQRSSTGRPMRGVQNQLTEVKLLQVSDTRYIEKVLTNVRQKLNRPDGDQMLDQRVNVLICFFCQQR